MSDAYEVVIIGGGLLGLTLATALAQADFSVAIVELHQPVLHWNTTDYDSRVSALHLGSHAFLKSLGIWSSIRAFCYSSLERLIVWDQQGAGRITFDAMDIAEDNLGYIVENREIIRVLWEYCKAHEHITLFSPVRPVALSDGQIRLDHGHKTTFIRANLIVGADGAYSWLRQQMAVECIEKPYHHNALIAVIETEKSHQNTAYQPFLTTGPLGVLPLSNPHHMAIVWSADPQTTERQLNTPLNVFDQELSRILDGTLGAIHCLSERRCISLIERRVSAYVQENKVLVGDAAHTIHPLAGQGANLGFMDVACLTQVLSEAKKHQKSYNCSRVLRRYERWRKSENDIMLLGMRAFKSLFSNHLPIAIPMRNWALNFTDHSKLLKRYFMRYAVHQQVP